MGLLYLFKRTASGQTTPLSTTQVDSNWQKIMDLFPTPANGTTDIGKVPALKADKTGFNYAPVISSIIPGANISIDVTDPNNPVISAINAPEMSIYKNGAYVGKKSNLNFVEDDGVELDVTENALQNRIDVKIKAEGGGGGGTWGSISGILSNQTDLQTALNGKVDENAAITGATKTKITYDSKGLVTSGADATTADIADSTNKRYVTDANLVVIGNTSGTNTGDNATNSQYSGLAASKQDTLVSGTNIKTINSNSLLGSGDLVITAGDGNDDFMLVASFKSLYNY